MSRLVRTVSAEGKSKPRLLDLFCGAGGAAMGYSRAGFEVIGVDIKDQPHYPFEFHQADAMTFPLDGFDAIHASPPCQAYSSATKHLSKGGYPLLVEEVRSRLRATGRPYVIENVPGAPLPSAIVLCGSMFGLPIKRHRLFEVEPWLMVAPHHCPPPVFVIGPGGRQPSGLRVYRLTGKTVVDKRANAADARRAMGIDWMNRAELTEAIPPAYTQWIGERLLEAIGAA